MTTSLDVSNFTLICQELAGRDPDLQKVLDEYGYPPLWSRHPGFATLVHIILEQQVSLASAWAAYSKLVEKCGVVTPEKILALSDEELKACYFSRQKTVYVRSLAEAVLTGRLNLPGIGQHTDDEIRGMLKQVKGIGDWTADVFLIFALHRADIFPIGDLAVVNACKLLKQLPVTVTREQVLSLSESWRPYRTAASMMLWHYYIKRRNIIISPAAFASAEVPGSAR